MKEPRKPAHETDRPDPTCPAARDYTAAEWEFVRAMEAWKKEHRNQYPKWSDAFAVMLALGYRKPDPEPK